MLKIVSSAVPKFYTQLMVCLGLSPKLNDTAWMMNDSDQNNHTRVFFNTPIFNQST